MCGRYVITTSPEELRRLFGYDEHPNMPPRFNIAPTQPVPVVMAENGARHFRLMRWGFLPAWLKDPSGFPLLINARAETVFDKAAFRNAIRRRRCLLPADGYYEWLTQGAFKQPFYIYPQHEGTLGLAGIAETWTGPNGEEVDTVAIVTTEAAPDLAELHHRAPVVIAPANFERWLDCRSSDPQGISDLLAAPAPGTFAWHPVSQAVNRVANDDSRLTAARSLDDIAAELQKTPEPRPRGRTMPTPIAAARESEQGSLF